MAEAMVTVALLISRMRSVICWIALTALPVEVWMPAICLAISSVAFAVWVASVFTSAATTAKPLPASPRARRLDGGVEGEQVGSDRQSSGSDRPHRRYAGPPRPGPRSACWWLRCRSAPAPRPRVPVPAGRRSPRWRRKAPPPRSRRYRHSRPFPAIRRWRC